MRLVTTIQYEALQTVLHGNSMSDPAVTAASTALAGFFAGYPLQNVRDGSVHYAETIHGDTHGREISFGVQIAQALVAAVSSVQGGDNV